MLMGHKIYCLALRYLYFLPLLLPILLPYVISISVPDLLYHNLFQHSTPNDKIKQWFIPPELKLDEPPLLIQSIEVEEGPDKK